MYDWYQREEIDEFVVPIYHKGISEWILAGTGTGAVSVTFGIGLGDEDIDGWGTPPVAQEIKDSVVQ